MVMHGSDTMSGEKKRHASYLFKEMGKFQKGGILCDIKVPGKLQLVPAHKIVLMSARSSEGDHPVTPMSPESEQSLTYAPDDVFLVDEAYSAGNEAEDNGERRAKSESLEERLGTLNSLRQQHCYCDVTLVTDNSRCDAHKVVLAAGSDYFRAMFTSNMRENAMTTIPLPGVEGSCLQRMLEFIYTGDASIEDSDDAIELLKAAVFYQIVELIHKCSDFLLQNIGPESACVVAFVGRDLALMETVARCRGFIHEHFGDLDRSDSDVDLLHPEDLSLCLRSDRLGVQSRSRSELSVLRIVLRWFLSNHTATPDNVQEEIAANVRFALIEPNDIMTSCRQILAERDDAASDVTKQSGDSFGSVFKRHLLKALLYHNQLYKQPLLQSTTTNLRVSKPSWVCVDGVMAPSTVKLPARSQRIAILGSEPATKNGPIRDPFHSVVELNGFVYVIGGTRNIGEGYSSVVIRYDPRLDTCIRVADMQVPRGDFVAVAHMGRIYVFGGRNRTGALSTCERYDPEENTWTYIASLAQPVYMAAGVAARGKIYVIGGFNDYDVTGDMFCYHPDEDRCEQVFAPMMADRGYHVIIEGPDGRLWALGGVDNPFSGRNVWEVEAFDLDSMMWHFVGQILPVSLFQSTLRLNVLINDQGRICVSAVTLPHKHPMLEYIPEMRMWFEMKERVPCAQITVDA